MKLGSSQQGRKGARSPGAKGGYCRAAQARATGRALTLPLPLPRREGGQRKPFLPSAPARPAFTLIELLIVIVVIGILIAAVALIGGRVAHGQKVQYTQTIMRTTMMAIDQFATQGPLRNRYAPPDSPGANGLWEPLGTPGSDDRQATFGAFPPYRLYRAAEGATVWSALEPLAMTPNPNTLSRRLHLDIGNGQGGEAQWALVNQTDARNDDIRALYTYLTVFAPGTLEQVPDDRIGPLLPDQPDEYVNPRGTGTIAGTAGVLDVLGIHDAWGVPLDYFLYVKLEWGAPRAGAGPGEWRVVDRKPVLRSRGIKREVYDRWLENTTVAPPDSAQTWIFGTAFPAPRAGGVNAAFWQSGTLGASSADNGWARALANGDEYFNAGVADDRAFGFVPTPLAP